MRFVPNIRFGTEGYPEKVARRLRAFNIAVWITASVPAYMALVRFVDAGPGKWWVAATDLMIAAVYVSTPLLHRFGALVAPLVFTAIGYGVILWVSATVGTNGGERTGFFVATALGILIIGTENVLITTALGIISIGLILFQELEFPRDTGFASSKATMFGNFAATLVTNTVVLYGIIFYAVRQMERAEEKAERERRRSDNLLVNILPPTIAERLKDPAGGEIADAYPEASVLFADMGGFTARARDTTPTELVRFLNRVFTMLDGLVERHGLEKIKTTGDGYVVVSGVPEPLPDHAGALAELALDMRDALAGLLDSKNREVPVRIGIASGPVVAGVVGTRKFFYDVWGDAVNTASRMESTGEAGKIQIAPQTRALLADRFALEERGVVEVRGKGPMRTWFLLGRNARPER